MNTAVIYDEIRRFSGVPYVSSLQRYVATLTLKPVTDGARCFAEWSAEFECAEGRERELSDTIGRGVFQAGLDALKRHFGRR